MNLIDPIIEKVDALRAKLGESTSPTLALVTRAVSDLDEIKGDLENAATEYEVMATALLDRLLHRCHVINIKGRSYRLRDLERALAGAK